MIKKIWLIISCASCAFCASHLKIKVDSPSGKALSPQTIPVCSPTTPKSELESLEKEAVKYWQETYAAAQKAENIFKAINRASESDVNSSLEIIEKAVELAEIANDLAQDAANQAKTPNAARAALLASKELDRAHHWLTQVLQLYLQFQEKRQAEAKK